MLALSIISLLTSQQRSFVGKLGDNFTTHDESELNSGSDLEKDNVMDAAALASKFAQSEDKVDQRLSKLYQISKTRFKNMPTRAFKNKSLLG